MPYDPNFPTADTRATASAMRAQLNALNDKIDSIPAGPPGPPLATVVVDSVTALPWGSAPTVEVAYVNDEAHLSFGLPQGPPGAAGADGPAGSTGPQGPPFAAVVVDSVTTLDPGAPATVTSSFDGTTVHLQIGLPRGADGAEGPAGEVSVAQMNTAITAALSDRPTSGQMNDAIAAAVATCSANSNSVAILETPFADPAAETLRQAFNTLVLTLRS